MYYNITDFIPDESLYIHVIPPTLVTSHSTYMANIKNKKMNRRLRDARRAAGFATATEAIEYFGWKSSTYRAHENGQNNFKAEDAGVYSRAYGVSAAWLLLGEDPKQPSVVAAKNKSLGMPTRHKHDCADHIYATALLLREDKENLSLLGKLQQCVESQINKVK